MNKSKLTGITAALLAGALVVAGCRQDDDDMYSDRQRDRESEARPVADPTPFEDAARSAKLREAGVPDDVRGLILTDLGDLPVADVQMRTTETGGPMYRVVYIVDGKAHERWYDGNGQRLQQPPPQPAETIDPATAGDRIPPTTRPAGGAEPQP